MTQGLQNRIPIGQAVNPVTGIVRISLLDDGREAERRTDTVRPHVDIRPGSDDIRTIPEARKNGIDGRDLPRPAYGFKKGTDFPLRFEIHDRQANCAIAGREHAERIEARIVRLREVDPFGVFSFFGNRFPAEAGNQRIDHEADMVLMTGAGDNCAFVGPQKHPRP